MRPKKVVPPSRVLEVRFEPGKGHSAQILQEEYPDTQKTIEEVLVGKLILYLNGRGRCVAFQRLDEHPDVVCEENERQLGIELSEIVFDSDIWARLAEKEYIGPLRKKVCMENLGVRFQQPFKQFPRESSSEGRQILDELSCVIRWIQRKGRLPSGNLLPVVVGGPGQADRCLGYVYVSHAEPLASLCEAVQFGLDGPPPNVLWCPRKPNVESLRSALLEKWRTNYTVGDGGPCMLLLYRLGGAIDCDQLKELVSNITFEHGATFNEVWLMRPLPAGDDIEKLYPL